MSAAHDSHAVDGVQRVRVRVAQDLPAPSERLLAQRQGKVVVFHEPNNRSGLPVSVDLLALWMGKKGVDIRSELQSPRMCMVADSAIWQKGWQLTLIEGDYIYIYI